MIAPNGISELKSDRYKGPSNSADLALGNEGYQHCGKLSYTILNHDYTPFTETWFQVTDMQSQAGEADYFNLLLT